MLLRTLHKKIEELMKKDPDNGNKEIRIAQYETLECDENGAVKVTDIYVSNKHNTVVIR